MAALSIALRPAQASDEGFLYEVYASTRVEELAPVPWTEDEKEAFLRQQFHAQHSHYQQHYPNAAYEIILIENQPAGRLYVDRSEAGMLIIDIALLPNQRRRGVGSQLLRELLEEAARDRKPVSLHVEHYNPAYHLYERLGFCKIGDAGVYDLLEWRPS